MPKVVSRSVVCPDQRSDPRDEDALIPYYCWCGHLGLILDCKIHTLPLRPRDEARIIDAKKHHFKLSCIDNKNLLKDEDIVYIKWNDNEIEKQYRLKCKKCNLWCFYKHSSTSDVIFIVNKSMNIRPRNSLPARRGMTDIRNRNESHQPSTSSNISANFNRRFATVTVSTMEEEEAEVEEKEIASSYEQNATIIQRELERQKLLKRRRLED